MSLTQAQRMELAKIARNLKAKSQTKEWLNKQRTIKEINEADKEPGTTK